MNDNAKKLVAALRSGEFEQGQNYLSLDDKYCVWGVACEVYQREVGGLEIGPGKYGRAIRYNGLTSLPPPSVRRWVGVTDYNRVEYLAHLNDEGRPFTEIADIIESEPEGLFND